MKKILLLFFVCIASIFNSYSQDTCITATAITAGSFVVTAVNGTEIPSPICTDNGAGAATGEWYVFTATVDGLAHVTTDLPANTGGNTRVHVYTGTCGSLVCVGGSDDVDVNGGNFLSDFT